MNNKFYLIGTTAVAILFSFSAGIAYATVGGPTLIYDIKFDSKTNSIYYTEQNYGGKGCPPELKAISLDTNTSKVIYSCDDGLKQYNYGPGQQEKIESFTSGFSILNPINLRKNDITVSVDVAGVDKSEFDPTNVMRTIYSVGIFQGGEMGAGTTLTGCSADQPVIIDGYAIPGVKDKIALLFSRKSDCFEGGYAGESMFVFPGLKVLDESPVYERKTNSPLVPHEGSLVAYAGESQAATSPSATEPTPQPTAQVPTAETDPDYSTIILVVSSALAFLVGLLMGRWKRKEPVITG